MAKLNTSYMGLKLNNPLVVGSSGITSTLDVVKRCEDAGAGAVVLRSVFEDEVRREYESAVRAHMRAGHMEAFTYQQPDLANLTGGQQYLELVDEATSALAIPVIASINCFAARSWGQYARDLEKAGAQAIEVNLHEFTASAVRSAENVESTYSEAVAAVVRNTKVPVAAKLPPYFTNVAQMAFQMELDGAAGLVLFNRPFLPDFDIESIELKGGVSLSQPGDYKTTLRWVSLLSSRVGVDLCASGGIHDGQAMIKQLLAGAMCVQVVSALYRMDLRRIEEMLRTLTEWMDRHGFETLGAFRGKLAQPRTELPHLLEKTQYSRLYMGL